MNASVDRAKIFKNYIECEYVEDRIFYHLIDQPLYISISSSLNSGGVVDMEDYSDLLNNDEYRLNIIQESYPDTYNFLKSLYYNEAEQKEYI